MSSRILSGEKKAIRILRVGRFAKMTSMEIQLVIEFLRLRKEESALDFSY